MTDTHTERETERDADRQGDRQRDRDIEGSGTEREGLRGGGEGG